MRNLYKVISILITLESFIILFGITFPFFNGLPDNWDTGLACACAVWLHAIIPSVIISRAFWAPYKNDKFYYKLKPGLNVPPGNDGIYYREPALIFLNLLLKILQPVKRPFLLCSISIYEDDKPHFDGYGFRRVELFDRYFARIKSVFITYKLVEKFYKEEK